MLTKEEELEIEQTVDNMMRASRDLDLFCLACHDHAFVQYGIGGGAGAGLYRYCNTCGLPFDFVPDRED